MRWFFVYLTMLLTIFEYMVDIAENSSNTLFDWMLRWFPVVKDEFLPQEILVDGSLRVAHTGY